MVTPRIPTRRHGRPTAAASFLATILLPLPSSALKLSGTVVNSIGQPVSGVVVTLAGEGIRDTTDNTGIWSLSSGPVGTTRTASAWKSVSGHLAVADGRLQLSMGGRDAAGRAPSALPSRPGAHTPAPRIASVTDTLRYAFRGKTFLTDTISESRSGIVRTLDSTWNPDLVYGWFQDPRDGRVYRTTTFAGQTWFAENLRFRKSAADSDSVGTCFPENPLYYCGRMGALYTWTEAMGVSANYTTTHLDLPPVPARGICPVGWHLPDDSAWAALRNLVSGTTGKPAALLRSRKQWYLGTGGDNGLGYDTYGLCLQPSGYRDIDGIFHVSGGYFGKWWSSTQISDSTVWMQAMAYSYSKLEHADERKRMPLAVRCVRD